MKRNILLLSFLLFVSIFSFGSTNELRQKRLQTAQFHLDRARQLEMSNDPRAEQEYKRAITALGGVYPEALRELSLYLQRRLRFSESLIVLKEYIKQTPTENHSDHFEEIEELDRAAFLKNQIKFMKRPKLQSLIDYSRLVSRYGENQFKGAIPYAEKAVQLYPVSPDAHLALANVLVGPGLEGRRCDAIDNAISLGSTSPYSFYQRGNCEIAARRVESAVQSFRKALEISNGQFMEAWQGLGWAFSLQGQNKEAISAFRTYLSSGKVPEHSKAQIEKKIKTLEM